ncbi:hypothetical protein LEM8419_00007 [Neolewinella maritima]|uniref:N-acetyltransferase domain-containing protein n=1 Tax=Neolewinella maritima TaxID=1383882 RepID=A0ABN8F2I9_9BACT|nr:GNAT family N-acetyltransferase [Neolewinella maritima]CAH0998662.1 hypothetical protein LEM8419_00007 [Neolewinella maritima]
MATLRFTPFTPAHYPEYKSWFADERLNAALGPMDEEWLQYVCTDTQGREYAVYRQEELVGVIGIQLPVAGHPVPYITNLAVHPRYHRQGIGALLLRELHQIHPLAVQNGWIAFVLPTNQIARRFFHANGWRVIEVSEDGTFRYASPT